MHLIVDAHEDLAWNALTFGRDYSRSALATREAERNSAAPLHNGHTLLGLPEYLLGHVAVVFSTLFAAPLRRKEGEWDALTYADAREAHRRYAEQLDYYERLVASREHEQFTLIRGRHDLEAVLATWAGEALSRRRVGLVPLMEGADGIREPREAEWWMERGVRIVGLAWAATRYAGGTGEPGPLTADGRRLLEVMADLGLILDLAHASDESFLEALERFEGTVIVSHANPRARLKEPTRPERHLSDDMLRGLAERGGVIGIVPYNRFLKSGWTPNDGKQAVTLDVVVEMIDHVCQVTGSAAHVGLGSDFDGGFGVESVPAEIDTVADLQKLGPALRARGYAETDVAGVLGQNWIERLRRGLPA
jgi:membrane dipeptidase